MGDFKNEGIFTGKITTVVIQLKINKKKKIVGKTVFKIYDLPEVVSNLEFIFKDF